MRGRGLFLAFDLPDGETRGKLLGALLDEGMLGLASGTRSIRFRPPLVLDEETTRDGLERLGRAVDSLF